MYDVRCTMYDVRCTMYDVRCTKGLSTKEKSRIPRLFFIHSLPISLPLPCGEVGWGFLSSIRAGVETVRDTDSVLERPFLRQKDLLAIGLHIHVTVITIVETIAEIKAVPPG